MEKLETGLRDIHAPGIGPKKGLKEEWICCDCCEKRLYDTAIRTKRDKDFQTQEKDG